MTKWIAGLALSGALAFAAPSTAEAQGPIVTGGLVNVTIVDLVDAGNILSDNNVGIGAALAIAANVCDVSVIVLAADLTDDGEATCTSENDEQQVTLTQLTGRRR
jgi:hypothetical protein